MVDQRVPGADRRGFQYASVTTAGYTFTVDVAILVTEIHFVAAGAALSTQTVSIYAENQQIWRSVPIVLLAFPFSASPAAYGTDAPLIWKPDEPLLFSATFPITVTPSATIGVAIHGRKA